MLKDLETEMLSAAQALEFERAAEIRDRIAAINEGRTGSNSDRPSASPNRRRGRKGRGDRIPKPKRP